MLVIRDLVIIIVLTLVALIVALFFDLSEQLYQWSRIWEKYQADELFFPLLMLLIGLIWFSWRRSLEAKSESLQNQELLAENRQLIQKITQTQEAERLYLSQELHDVFSQYLTALRTQADYLQTLLLDTNTNELTQQAIKKIVTNVDKLHSTTRSLLKTLRPPLLEFGVVMAVEDLVTEWQHNHKNIQCSLDFHGLEPDLNDQELLTLYRTIQEGLSNIARHAKAQHVDINLYLPTETDSEKTITIQIIDDGIAFFSPETVKTGLGLIGIRERASALNGIFNISTQEPSGTKLELCFPIHAKV
jgi:signal transduction histidine kinase